MARKANVFLVIGFTIEKQKQKHNVLPARGGESSEIYLRIISKSPMAGTILPDVAKAD